MFKTDRAAKIAIVTLGCFLLAGGSALFVQGAFADVVLILGLILILVWAYLNPWIVQMEYSFSMFLDYERMKHNAFVIAGMTVATGSVVMRWL